MNDIVYVGEHLLAGTIGRLLIYLSFLAGFAGIFFYLKLLKKGAEDKSLLKFARSAYLVQTFSIVGISISMLYLIVNHCFEYSYIYQHSSSLMPAKFIISSFWAGQEGSFLLWAFFIGTFGVGAMLTARKLEGPAMMIVILAQLFLMTMLLGINIAGIPLGNDPFLLLRQMPVNAGNDFFMNPDYLSFITDGNGLNPLLENPWMVIHPPMLFMGYATAIFPFAFAFASLFMNDKRYWLKPVLPWVLLSVGLLGTGLIMGGAWAYQSLTFGGFWAWDPVENASFVPWLVLVAALHYILLSYKRDKYYLGTYIFTFLGFIMVLYASYLTRSGVLGETSVHAFGDDGRSFQLVLFMMVFILLAAWILIKRRKDVTSSELPNLFNREFLMMYGSIVILLSAFQVISTTSVPVINKIFGTGLTPPSDVVGFYNTWQVPFAILVTILLGLGQYVAYGKNDPKQFWRFVLYPVILSVVVGVIGFIADPGMRIEHGIFLVCIAFAIFTSLGFLFRFSGGKGNTGAALTHVGFGIFLLGVLLAMSNTEVLSKSDKSAMTGGSDNIMLFRDQVKEMGDYSVCFSDIKTERDETFYQIDYLKKGSDDKLYKQFSLFPSLKVNSRMGNVHNPDTRNMLQGDVFMFLTYAEDPTKRMPDGYALTGTSEVAMGDTLAAGSVKVLLDSLYVESMDENVNHVKITALLKSTDSSGKVNTYPLTYEVKDSFGENGIINFDEQGVRIRFDNVSDKPRSIIVGIFEKQPEFVVAKILFFPWIWVLWAGSVIMFSGVTISIWKRAVKAKRAAE
ncbi:MAG: cytochrome c biogenesis protein CcsA [Bacteroidales bacterium]|nr:cytochrome c biogenesis protein CcsA [Bacteroidales bacterium]